MFAEAIPGVIIQQLAILKDGRASTAALTSLTISALTTGFVSASISYDWDTDMMWRKIAPIFYGYIPNDAGKRTGNVIVVEDEHRDIVALFADLPILILSISLCPSPHFSNVSFIDVTQFHHVTR